MKLIKNTTQSTFNIIQQASKAKKNQFFGGEKADDDDVNQQCFLDFQVNFIFIHPFQVGEEDFLSHIKINAL